MPALKDLNKELKKIPGWTTGTRHNEPVRTITLAQPICPYSAIEMERNYQGEWVPKKGPTDPTRQNCQRAGGAWWKDCARRGHGEVEGVPEGLGPWFREIVWYTTDDDVDETGLIIGTKRFKRSMVIPNLKQVAVAEHLNNGLGARRAIERKGCKRLNEIGYEEVCQFRNCQNPVKIRTGYGDYCCDEELALVAAAADGVALSRPNATLNGSDENKFVRLREKQLHEALAMAKDKSV